MTPTSSLFDNSTTLRRWQVGPCLEAQPYTNSAPLRESVSERRIVDIDLRIAAVMPTIAEIDAITTEQCKDWRNDTSSIEIEDR